MTIDEAIEHAEEVAEEHTNYNIYGGFESCDECAEEHRQLAEWLRELKRNRDVLQEIRQEVDKYYQDIDKCFRSFNGDIEEFEMGVLQGCKSVLEIIDKHIGDKE